MFPIGDEDVKESGVPWMTWAIIVVNVLVFLYELTLSRTQLEQFYMTYGVVPTQIMQGQNLISLLTSMFLHGGWLHILSNMVFLAVFGDNIEATLGKVLYLGFYLLGGLTGSAAHLVFNMGTNVPSLGASGAIAAVLGAYVVMFPQSRVRVLFIFGIFARVTRVTAILFMGFWFVTQLFNGVATLGPNTAQTGGIAYWAHIGGFVLGLIVGFLARALVPEQEREIARDRDRRF
jgi:membrane associated rhomboid family serine protease